MSGDVEHETTPTGAVIREARRRRRWSQERLARELAVAEGRGPGGLDRGSVYRWERGSRVPRYWRPYLIEVLELRSPEAGSATESITTTDETTGSSAAVGDTVASLVELGHADVRRGTAGRGDVERREFFAVSSAAALGVLGMPDPAAILRRVGSNSDAVRVGAGEVGAARHMYKILGDTASELGGGHARHLVVRYLTDDVARWLGGTFTEQTGKQLYSAASQLTHLAGWMAQDEGLHGLAQQYYGHAFRLAEEADEPDLAATALRGLAAQAMDLRHHAAAVRFADACVQRVARIEDPRAVAYYEAALANAAALDGDRRTATVHLAASEKAVERAVATAPTTSGEAWASHYSPGRWTHESATILARMGDLDMALEHLHLALDVHGLDRKRTRAIVLADLGDVHMRRGDHDSAFEAYDGFLACAEGVQSVRITKAAEEMRARLSGLNGSAQAEELDQRGREVTAG
jgi:transcriptional regulator with XRE-family HTH domain